MIKRLLHSYATICIDHIDV